MGLWIRATLNRYIPIGGADEEEDAYEYSERIEKTYIKDPKSLELAKKYGVYLNTTMVNDGDLVLFMIHNKDSEVRDHLYAGELWDIPDVKDDETFFQRTEDFAKEFLLAFPSFEEMEFSSVGKRFTAVS